MNNFFAYTRVSTVKQGERGVSLQEQRSAIEQYAIRHQFNIDTWFQETETAAKRGRPVFIKMLNLLRAHKAGGVIIHKIDRSARNLKDWSDLAELMDAGIEVHFANESLDLSSRGGRLSADIQAVVAADFIRNLREETRKGIHGRLKQGLFPMPAPLGYLDCGTGNPKAIDPVRGPLIRRLFEEYASGKVTLGELQEHAFDIGLRTKSGGMLCVATLSNILRNPFYLGLIRLKKTNQIYQGKHAPLVPRALFEACATVSKSRFAKKAKQHDLKYRRAIRCKSCGFNLTGELRKGHVYYRCHSMSCPTNSIREEEFEAQLMDQLSALRITDEERAELEFAIATLQADGNEQREAIEQTLKAQLGHVNERLSKLTDAYLDGFLERSVLDQKQKALLMERVEIEDRLRTATEQAKSLGDAIREFIDFVSSVPDVISVASPDARQSLIRTVASKIEVAEKQVFVTFGSAFEIFAHRSDVRTETCPGVQLSEGQISNSTIYGERTVLIDDCDRKSVQHASNEQSGCPEVRQRGTYCALIQALSLELTKTRPYGAIWC